MPELLILVKSRAFKVAVLFIVRELLLVLLALDCQETVTRVLVYFKTTWQVSCLRALIFAEVVDSLLLATAKDYILGV
jgi:hypothetical protein